MKSGNLVSEDAPDTDDLFEMANLFPRTTGLPMTVWVRPTRQCTPRRPHQSEYDAWQPDEPRQYRRRRRPAFAASHCGRACTR